MACLQQRHHKVKCEPPGHHVLLLILLCYSQLHYWSTILLFIWIFLQGKDVNKSSDDRVLGVGWYVYLSFLSQSELRIHEHGPRVHPSINDFCIIECWTTQQLAALFLAWVAFCWLTSSQMAQDFFKNHSDWKANEEYYLQSKCFHDSRSLAWYSLLSCSIPANKHAHAYSNTENVAVTELKRVKSGWSSHHVASTPVGAAHAAQWQGTTPCSLRGRLVTSTATWYVLTLYSHLLPHRLPRLPLFSL